VSDFLTRISKLSPQRLALLAAQLNERLEALEEDRSAPIAIVGMGCRFPGGVRDAETLWKLLSEGIDAIREVPADRWKVDDYYDRNPDTPGKMATRWGGFIDEPDQFDPKFFGIAPAEATPMDPQQRLLLESTWEALEDAGIPPSSLAGSLTGIFVGICNSDYANMALGAPEETITPYFASGLSHAVAAGRISYVLGLEGLSLAVDTSCSASLMAVHLACQSLRRKESHLALAGGVNLILTPQVNIALSQSHMMAPDGRCKAFSDNADGFVRSEGAGMIVLKRLRDAVQDGNRVLAVIRGTAANQDGRSSGLTAPNGRSQQAVIRAALADAGMHPDDLQYIEAHGTGTALGDPIEIGALENVFAERQLTAEPLRVGSIKSNLGHLESAAGVAGLMKLVLSLQHKQIPASLHCQKPNHRIDWDRIPLRLSKQNESWPVSSSKRAGGVSSFGFSGTNVHVIVEEHIEERDVVDAPAGHGASSEHPLLFPISAKSHTALRSIATRLISHLGNHPDLPLAGIARTLTTGRSHFDHRFALAAASREELLEVLRSFEDIARDRHPETGRAAGRSPRVGFLFADHQFAYSHMGRDLYEAVPKFREVIQRCEDILLDAIGRPLTSLMYPQSGANPAIAPEILPVVSFAAQYALSEVWRSCGLEPALALGMGTGECIAACVAGVIRLEDALPLLLSLERDNPQDAEAFATRISYSAPRLPWLTAETNQREKCPLWLRNARAASAALPISGLKDENCSGYVTMAHPAAFEKLAAMAGGELSGKSFSSRDGQLSDLRAFMQAAAGLYILGCEFEFTAFYGKARAQMVSLPGYPFERERYWLDVEKNTDSHTALSPSEAEQPEGAEDWLYELAWEPRPFPEQTGGPAGQSFSSLLEEVVPPQPTEPVLRVDEAVTRVQQICGGYARSILAQLGLKLSPGKEFTPDALCRELRIASGRERILERILNILAEDGLLERDVDVYRCVRLRDQSDPDSELAALKALYPELGTELAILKRCTASTAAVLQGSCDPMQLLFAEESVWEQIYESSPVCRYFNEAAQEIIERATKQMHGRTARILEIGGGTGATTASVLPAIASGSIEYTFTDISPVFLSKARQKFKDFAGVHYKLLNIERSPVEQGFALGGYDIVLAANVLHATRDLRQTVAHARQLLRPGGLLMLIEGVRPDRWLEMTLGLSDGWWRLTDRDLRPESPLISSEQWQTLFREQGMDVSRALHYQTRAGGSSQQVLMLACSGEADPGAQRVAQDRVRWIVFSDSSGIGTALAALLRDSGEHCELIAEPALDKPESTLEALRMRWPHVALEIVYLGALDAVVPEDLERNIELCMQTPVRMMQATLRDPRGATHLWLVTRGAQATTQYAPTNAGAQQAMLWGAGRVFSVEHPDSARRLIDLDPTRTPEENAADLLRELLHEDVEDQVAYRGGERIVPRLQHAQPPILEGIPGRLRSDGSYLITGGLGYVGLEVAQWAAKQGAGHLVLLGRTGVNEDGARMRAVEGIRASGTPVTVISGDVASPETMEGVFALFGKECPELRGVFHAATAQGLVELAQLSQEQIAEMLRPKVQGTWLLHEWTRKRKLDFLIAFSSAASLTGSQRLAHYAAANQFMDNFAYARRAQGLPMLSANWGVWEKVKGGSFFREMGLPPMESAKALRWLSRLTASPRANVMIADVDWKTLKTVYETRRVRPMLAALGTTPATSGLSASMPLIPAIAGEAHEKYIEQSVISASAKVLGFRAGEFPPTDVPLTDLGLDSLMAVDLRNRLQSLFGRELPPTIVFDYPTIAGLTGMLETMLWAADSGGKRHSITLQDEILI
jgi:acyl transferase domain-containing protein/acyl carrier protein